MHAPRIFGPLDLSQIHLQCNPRDTEGVGIGIFGYEKKEFGDCAPLDDDEIYKFIGLIFTNGLNPLPFFETWFTSATSSCTLKGNSLLSSDVMDKIVHDVRVPGICRWMHLCCFLTLTNYHLNPSKEQHKNPMWKVQSLVAELNYRARQNWIPGECVAIDKQTIGFKGRSEMKLRISYKREGNGFQCNALCNEGYTFSFFFWQGGLSCRTQQDVLFCLLSGSLMFGQKFIWTTCITQKNFLCTVRSKMFRSRSHTPLWKGDPRWHKAGC